MSESIVLSIQPDRVTVDHSHQWQTVAIEMESGHEQRRTAWAIKKVDLTLTFRQAFENGELDDFIAFFDARKGAFESFTIPSWIDDARLTADYTPPSTTLQVSSADRFTTDATSIGNLIVVGKFDTTTNKWVMESTRIAAMNGTTLTLTSALSTVYSTNDYVYVGYLVRFANDTLNMRWIAGKARIATEIEFRGVFA